MCKRIYKFELQWSSYWQNIKFSRYYPKFHIFTKIVIFKYICNFLDQLLHPYKFYGRDMSGLRNTLFHFCQLWAVKWPRYFYSLIALRGVPWNLPLRKNTFPPEFCNEICIRNHNSGGKKYKCCTVLKWRPNNRFLFRVVSILIKIWIKCASQRRTTTICKKFKVWQFWERPLFYIREHTFKIALNRYKRKFSFQSNFISLRGRLLHEDVTYPWI